jgi:UDP-N-acetyl-D-galactosamine dehydrogenase
MFVEKLKTKLTSKEEPIAIIGLGYVGLPLACILAEKYKVVGFDISAKRVGELKRGEDLTREVEEKSKLLNKNLTYTDDPTVIGSASLIIVAVPTPVDRFNVPDLAPVILASKTVGKHLKKGAIVVYESTVYPSLTETICKEHLEKESGLRLNEGFYLGYSPERVVPGDKQRTIEKITKIVSGSTDDVAELLKFVYGSVISAGIHKAPSIAVAEAAKVIENAQRDLNIAFVNELSMLFDRIGIDTLDVLEAAGTKWNFLPFKPGLVGGHCIGVDPYYLTYLAEGSGFQTQVISAGRRINDQMGSFVAQKTVTMVINAPTPPKGPLNVAVLGITFKENVPDIRNSKVAGLADALESYGVKVHIFDPLADPQEVKREYGKSLVSWDQIPTCDAVILAVTHEVFKREYPMERLVEKMTSNKILVDLKGALPRKQAKDLGIRIWRL